MPRATARIKRKYIEGHTEVCPWEIEEALLRGVSLFGPVGELQRRDDWQRAWDRWGAVILPKALEHRPGLRPLALYAIGEIPARELRMPLPAVHGWQMLRIPDETGQITVHYLDVPEPFIESEATYLRRLGIITEQELRRHRAWMRRHNAECEYSAPDTYVLEMGCYV